MKRNTRGALIVGATLLFSAGAGCGRGTVPVEERCETGDQRCDDDDRLFSCEDERWVDQGITDRGTCACIEGEDGCVAVGYVGVTRSGRARDAGRRLRAA